MIKFADNNTKPLVWSMWKTVFGDKDEYIDLIFTEKYKDENTLLYFEENKPVASLQMFPYTIRFYGQPVTFYYLAGLCTLPEYRNKGYMGKLLLESFKVMQERNIALSILVPAEEWLFGYYEKYGYTTTFEKGNQQIDLESLTIYFPNNIDQRFNAFDEIYQQTDFTVLKNKQDLQIIIEEYIQDSKPTKFNLAGMSRVINPLLLLNLYAQKNPYYNFIIKVNDTQLNHSNIYEIKNGIVEISKDKSPLYEVDQNLLTRLLFGYKLNELDTKIALLFEEHNPLINLMLE